MIVRQNYINPFNGKKNIRDIRIDFEEVRGSNAIEMNLIAFCDDLMVSTNPQTEVFTLLDNKRTFVPPTILQSYLTDRIESRMEIACIETLKVHINDPMVIMNNYGEDIQYFIVGGIEGNIITPYPTIDLSKYNTGSIIQNLSNRWWFKPNEMGITSKLSQPEPLPFLTHIENNCVVFNVTTPLNINAIKCYDIYVRSQKFSQLEPHWIPDAYNIDIYESKVTISTYGGGEKAGGGILYSGDFFATVIAKDSATRINTNESSCIFTETIHI
jgi:hypothetical protein